MRKLTLLLATLPLAGTVGLPTGPALAQAPQPPSSTQAQIDALARQIEALQGELAALRATVAKDVAAVDKKVTEAPRVTVDNGRLTVRQQEAGPDGKPRERFSVALRGRLHYDAGFHFASDDAPQEIGTTASDRNDGTTLRRAFLGAHGTLFRDFVYRMEFDFGNTDGASRVHEAILSYQGLPNWSFDIGVSRPSLTLEDQISSNDIPFLERAAVVNVVAAGIGGGRSRRLVGSRHWGERYHAGLYLTGEQGIGSASNASDEEGTLVGRVAVLPVKTETATVHLGTSGQWQFSPRQATGNGAGTRTVQLDDRAELRIDDSRLVSTAAVPTLPADQVFTYGGELGATWRSAWLLSEGYIIDVDTLPGGTGATTSALGDTRFDGWYVAAGWVVTGERRRYDPRLGAFRSPDVKAPFLRGTGGLGVLEVAARYSVLDLNDDEGRAGFANTATGLPVATANPLIGVRGGEQRIVTVGVNWYVNTAIRFMLNYQNVDINRLNAAGVKVGGGFDVVAARAQLAF